MNKTEELDDGLVFYTITDIMKIFKLGKNKAYYLIKTKGFPVIKVGRKSLVPKAELKKWVKQNIGCDIYLP